METASGRQRTVEIIEPAKREEELEKVLHEQPCNNFGGHHRMLEDVINTNGSSNEFLCSNMVHSWEKSNEPDVGTLGHILVTAFLYSRSKGFISLSVPLFITSHWPTHQPISHVDRK